MASVRLALGSVVTVALAAGCGGRALMPDGGGSSGLGGLGNRGGGGTGATGGTDGASFTPTRDVDLLFMIDNSSSVRLLQSNLLSNFPSFVNILQGGPGGLPNLHVAVITSDMGAGDGSIAGCNTTGGDAGRFQYAARGSCTATNLQPGATFISNDNGVANYTGQLSDVFSCIAEVGENGCSFEQPLAAIVRALGADGKPAPAENQGFLRPDAFLFIVVATDEDDCSVPAGSGLFDTASGTTLASPLGPIGSYRCNEFGHLCNGVKPPRRAPSGSAADVVTLDGCVSAESAGLLTPVGTLAAQLRALKRFPDQQILFAAITGPSAPYTVHWKAPTTADPGGPWPEISHSCTALDQSVGDPAIRINQLAGSFGANGQVLSVCETSYAPSLQTLAGMIVQQLPPPDMP
ncbi:MAG TPA: hypothetical protein VIF57_06935 [Polyangia bacterium]